MHGIETTSQQSHWRGGSYPGVELECRVEDRTLNGAGPALLAGNLETPVRRVDCLWIGVWVLGCMVGVLVSMCMV